LTQNKVGLLYDKYKTAYEKQLITWADAEVRNTVGKFKRTEFYEKRAAAADAMKAAVNDKFK